MANNRYITQLRRGWKWDSDPDTGLVRNDWATYEAMPDHQLPLEGELVLEYDNGIPRIKIGDGKTEFSQLPYMSVDSFVIQKAVPKTVTATLLAANWSVATDENGNTMNNTWAQVVLQNSEDITVNSKVNLQPSAKQLVTFKEQGWVFVAENEDGIITVFCVGPKPTIDITMQATVKEVVCNG